MATVDTEPVPRELTGFEQCDTDTLVTTRRNMLRGLDLIAESIDVGKMHIVGQKGMAPPSQSGQLTLVLLVLVNTELVSRGLDTIFKE